MDTNGTHRSQHAESPLSEETDGGSGVSNRRTRARARDYTPAYEKPPRRPASDRDASFNKLAWVVDGVAGMMEEVLHSDLGLSEDFWTHLYAARREGLLALQAFVDDLVEKSGAEPGRDAEPETPPKKKRGGIEIDF